MRIIETAWCLNCGHWFMADRDEIYKCPKCGEILSLEKENMRYIIDKKEAKSTQ